MTTKKGTKIKIDFLPKTALGKWAVGLSLVFIIFILMKMLEYLPLPTFAIAVIGLISFVFSIIAVLKNKDRGILNLLPILVGIAILFWAAGEIIYPH